MDSRRHFLATLMAAGALPALRPELIQQAAAQATAETDPDTLDFWNGFLRSPVPPAARVPPPGGTGLARGGPATPERQAFFFHAGPDGLRPAVDLQPEELLTGGDVTLSVNMAAFRPAREDRDSFERLQNAQLRLDVIQTIPLIELIDTAAWTAVAMLLPDRQDRLPPLQDLSFDPGTVWQRMQNIVLPGGQGQWAVNLYAQRRDGFFAQLLRVLNTEVGRFAPILGLPGISTLALQSFNAFYGAFHSRPQHLFQSYPIPVYATTEAMRDAGTSRGLPLQSGTYLLVPMAHAAQLTPERLSLLQLRQGFMVPRNTPAVSVMAAAAETLPDVTYATLDVRVRRVELNCGTRSR